MNDPNALGTGIVTMSGNATLEVATDGGDRFYELLIGTNHIVKLVSGVKTGPAGINPTLGGQFRATALTTGQAIGYLDDGLSAVTVRLTLNGDADLDGGVSINAFNALAAAFGQSGGLVWMTGDFDYDGGVSINDFNLLADNFGRSLDATSSGRNATALALCNFAIAQNDIAGFVAATGVPEPAALTLLGGATLLGRRLRRRGSATSTH